jgi:sugar O-acyltransferase (sialic acid O-acetyltransferase NeuD family)
MLIIGAKGFAKEVLEILYQLNDIENIAFYDDVSTDLPSKLFDIFHIIRNNNEAKKYLSTIDNRFTIGIGSPILRKIICDKFENIGGVLTSSISNKANIGHFGNQIGLGCNIMTGVVITNNVKIGKGVLINLNCTIGHDTNIGDFVEISPGSHLSGNAKVGNYCNIGTNATILPNVNIGKNVIVGAGSVVNKDVQDNCLVVGIPAVIKKQLNPLNFE